MKPLIKWLYKKFVNELYVPEKVQIKIGEYVIYDTCVEKNKIV